MKQPQPRNEQRRKPAPGKKDIVRWFLFRTERLSIEEIAARQRVAPHVVQSSLDYVQEWKLYNSNELVDAKINEVVLSSISETGNVFQQGMRATRLGPKGKQVADHATRLKTVDTMRSFAELARPKSPIVQNNAQFNNNFGGPGNSPSAGSFESWLRNKRAEQGLDNGEDYIEGEGNQEQSAEDELADIGIDIAEDDEGEEETDQSPA